MVIEFYIRVSGKPHSLYRSAEGVYQIELDDSGLPLHMQAAEALSVAMDYVPFIQESPTSYSIDVFDRNGVHIPTPTSVCQEMSVGLFRGRAVNFPEHIAHA